MFRRLSLLIIKTMRFSIINIFISSLLLLACIGSLSAQTLDIRINGFKNQKGAVQIGIFKDQKSFEDDTPFIKKCISKSKIKNGELKTIIELSQGIYGIAILDDENENCKMDYSFFIPDEGIGFSQYEHSGLKRPRFKNFSFQINNQEVKVIHIKMKYY